MIQMTHYSEFTTRIILEECNVEMVYEIKRTKVIFHIFFSIIIIQYTPAKLD